MKKIIAFKKILVLLICLASLISASACGKQQVNEERLDELVENMDLETFLQTVDLPDNFFIGFDASEVKSVDSAKVYKAVSLEFDADEVAKKLLKREIVSTKVYAEGPQFETGDNELKEYLTVYDGGKSFGVDSGVVGGLNYSMYVNGESLSAKLSKLISNEPGPPDSIAQEWGYNLKSDYASFADLSFMSYKDALAEVKKLLCDTLGFPELEVAEAYSMDLETMLEHYELYLESWSHFGGDKEEITLTKDDECYVFFFRQVIDDIPVINVIWQGGRLANSAAGDSDSAIRIAAGNPMPCTSISVCYDRNGVRDIRAHGLYKIVESREDKPLVSAAKALQVVIDDYSEILLASETIVESMELYYVGIPSADGYQLIPAWVFCIAKANKWSSPADGRVTPVYSYEYYVVDAITGEKLSS